jgi:hypothetical protein
MKYNFEEYFSKWEDHNAAINFEKKIIDQWPTVRIKVDENNYKLGLTIHKWKIQPTGDALAIIPIGGTVCKEDIFWTTPHDSKILDEFKNEAHKLLDSILQKDIEDICLKIENGEAIDALNIHVYKYHASQWRQIEKSKSKWAYKQKDAKSEICNVQRLLQ